MTDKSVPCSAIVVAYDHGESILPTLRALATADIDEVIVWDNSTNPATRKAIETDSVNASVRIETDGQNHGFGGGINRASLLANPEADLLLINPDCIIDTDTLLSLRQTLSSDSNIGVVAPLMRYPSGELGISGGQRPSSAKELLAFINVDALIPTRLRPRAMRAFERLRRRPGAGMSSSLSFGEPVDVEWVSGFCMLLRREAVAEGNLFNEAFFMYFEDVDICRRLADQAWRCVLDRRTSALHFESTSMTSSGKNSHYYDGLATYMTIHGNRADRAVANILKKAAR